MRAHALLAAIGRSDPLFASVKALLHFNGANASTTFTDQKGHTFTPTGNAQISTAQSVFGGASGLFDGSGDYISAASSSDWDLSGDFCIEMRIRPTAVSGTPSIISRGNASAVAAAYLMFINTGGILTWTQNANEGGGYSLESTTALATGTWYSVCVDRSGSSMKLFINGTAEDTFTSASNLNNAAALEIGGSSFGTFFDGYIDELRFTLASRHQSNYSVEGAPFPDA